MLTILGLSGSTRAASYNGALLRAAAAVPLDGAVVEIGSIREIPLYDGDVEAQGIPAPVAALKERVTSAAGLLLVTPEYNGSIPGRFKNAIDWLSRPDDDLARVFGGRPVGIIGATPGLGGTRLSQTAWLPVFRALGLRPWLERTLYVMNAATSFDETGVLRDDKLAARLVAYMQGSSTGNFGRRARRSSARAQAPARDGAARDDAQRPAPVRRGSPPFDRRATARSWRARPRSRRTLADDPCFISRASA